ncbi:MAG: hypothetical protein IT559_05995 [Alphaproteobacteria bacterium]|nr:hypothetical protein [Alphaproteobacteria bacterium]
MRKFKNSGRSVFLYIPLILTGIYLASCGFQPVYGVNKYTATGVETRLEQIEIGGIPNREGQFLRNALIDRFYRNGRPASPLYALDVETIQESKSDLDITKNADATRGQLRLSADFKLTDTRTGEILLQRTALAVTSYNILSSEFTNRVSEQNTRENALNDLARQIELQITLYLKNTQ